MKRLFEKRRNPKSQKAAKIIGYTALAVAATAFAVLIILLPILSASGIIKFDL